MGFLPSSMFHVDRSTSDSNVQWKRNSSSAGRVVPFLTVALSAFLSFGMSSPGQAASYLQAEQLYYSGKYEQCLETALAEFDRGVWNDRWPQLALRCLLTLGRYEEAKEVYERAKTKFATSIGIRMFGDEVLRFTGNAANADAEVREIVSLVQQSPWRYSTSTDLVTLGRFFAEQGEDAREVLELFFDRVRKRNSSFSEVHIASAELALKKNDYQLAIESLEEAEKLQPFNPDVFYLKSRALRESDRGKAVEALTKALQLNPRHVPSLLFKAEFEIDAELYAEADSTLAEVLAVNPFQPEAWALHAVIAHVMGHYQGELILRKIALSKWSTNFEVDHLIGRKLSAKYRFREGAEYQRKALSNRPDFLPAKFQLAQDLLRLGDEPQGWQLAQEVFDQDGYNVVAYNLVTLHDQISRFAELRNERFLVRMDARESRIYGSRVLELLDEAYSQLTQKYDVLIDGPVIVEIFPKQQDFAIRTFGLPGGAGYLGVCFGRVITANSPASQGESPANWKSVLWHEFCHVVTLEKTRNRMPRWLSEGISVYEERQRNEAWGERLTPAYQQMILNGELTPIAELSSAFLRPPSPVHLQFAYYESSLVVEFIIERFGYDTLKRILDDLAIGMPINDALQRYTISMEAFEQEFAQYARQIAETMAPELSFERKELSPDVLTVADLSKKDRKPNYWDQHQLADRLLNQSRTAEARAHLETLFHQFPQDRSPNSAAMKLIRIYRDLELAEREQAMLEHVATLVDDALPVHLRLAEIYSAKEDWNQVVKQAELAISIQPMSTQPHQYLAKASSKLQRHHLAVKAYSALLEMSPVDLAGTHYQLALALHKSGQAARAKRHVLKALEEAPRYREALALLRELAATEQTESKGEGETNHDADEE